MWCPGTTAARVDRLVTDVRAAVSFMPAPYVGRGGLTVSVGAVLQTLPPHAREVTLHEMLAAADEAMFTDKRRARPD